MSFLTLYKEKLRIVKKPILSLILFAVLSLIIGFVPQTVDNIYLVPPLAFLYGTVTTSFGEVSGIAYNNAFMTGILNVLCWLLEIISTKRRLSYERAWLLFSSFVFGLFFSLFDDLLSGEDNSRCSSYDEYLLLQYAFLLLGEKKRRNSLNLIDFTYEKKIVMLYLKSWLCTILCNRTNIVAHIVSIKCSSPRC